MKNTAQVDIVIFGAGIAGLWLLNRVKQLGYSAILLETNTIGGGQTHKSQGIIHGGLKYALQGSITSATKAISDMPKVWQACLQGKGILDLSQVPILSQNQYLWATGSLASKLSGFFASKMLKEKVETLSKENYPEIFRGKNFHGSVYSLQEIVLDANQLIQELVNPYQAYIFKIDNFLEDQLHFDANNQLTLIDLGQFKIHAQYYIFTAGSGNEILANCTQIKMQRRPLQMVMMKTDLPYSLYAHCLGLSVTPRMTITTHKAQDGKTIWYLGGQIAEEGVRRTREEQIQLTKKELKELFSWIDFSNAEFATFFVDRAEALQSNGERPDSCFVKKIENMLVAWPTKLAFAPKLAEEIISLLQVKHQPTDMEALNTLPRAKIAKPIWDEYEKNFIR